MIYTYQRDLFEDVVSDIVSLYARIQIVRKILSSTYIIYVYTYMYYMMYVYARKTEFSTQYL